MSYQDPKSSDLEEFKAIFLLANIPVSEWVAIPCKYTTDGPHWFLAIVESGIIEIGWRKRVINIDWSRTKVRKILSEDKVSKEETYIHAWSSTKAIEYLSLWKKEAELIQRKEEIAAEVSEGLEEPEEPELNQHP